MRRTPPPSCPGWHHRLELDVSLMAYRLHLMFEDRDAFRVEFERNIAMGGAFIPTSDPLELRSFVEVAIELPFCEQSLVLEIRWP